MISQEKRKHLIVSNPILLSSSPLLTNQQNQQSFFWLSCSTPVLNRERSPVYSGNLVNIIFYCAHADDRSPAALDLLMAAGHVISDIPLCFSNTRTWLVCMTWNRDFVVLPATNGASHRSREQQHELFNIYRVTLHTLNFIVIVPWLHRRNHHLTQFLLQ